MTDERGQAITLNYAIGLGIGVVLVTGLLIAGGEFVHDQRERAARSELRVLGQQLGADLAAADRLAGAGESNTSVRVSHSLPNTVAGSTYSIQLVEAGTPYFLLETNDPSVTIRVDLTNETQVTESTVSGGDVAVNYTANGKLRLEGSMDG